MEVHEGQRTSTIMQAEAHNTKTVISDLEMFVKLLEKRGDTESLVAVRRAYENLNRAYADLLEQYGELVGSEVMDHEGHMHEGNERTLVQAEVHDAGLARKFETR